MLRYITPERQPGGSIIALPAVKIAHERLIFPTRQRQGEEMGS
jgi:hypothetical protein